MYIENKSHGETQLYAFLLLNSFKGKNRQGSNPPSNPPTILNNLKKKRPMNSSRAGYEIFTQVQGQIGILLFMGQIETKMALYHH